MRGCEPRWVATMADGRERGQDGSGWPLAAGLGVLVGVAALVCLWGTTAGALFGGGAPPVKPAELARVLVTLPDHLANPRLAWPASTRASLPGPFGFYASLVLLMAIVGLGAAVFMRWRGHSPAATGWRPAGRELGTAHRSRLVAIRVSVEDGSPQADISLRRADGAWVERAAAASGRGTARPGRIRSATVRKVGRTRGRGAPGMGGADDRVVDQDGSASSHGRPTSRARSRLRLRPVRAEWRIDEYLDAASRRYHVRRRPRGCAQIGVRRRDRPAVGREWRILDGRRGAASRTAALCRRVHRARHCRARSMGIWSRRARASRHAAGPRPKAPSPIFDAKMRRPPTTQPLRSRRSPSGLAGPSKGRSKRCCACTAPGACSGPPHRATSRRQDSSTATTRCTSSVTRRRPGYCGRSSLPYWASSLTTHIAKPTSTADASEHRSCCASTSSGMWHLYPISPRSPRRRPATTFSLYRSSTTSRNLERGTVGMPKLSSTATGRGCSSQASPIWTRFATSRALVGDQLARDETRTTGPGYETRSENPARRPLAPPEQLRQLPDGHALLVYGRLPPAIVRLRMWFEDGRLRELAAAKS